MTDQRTRAWRLLILMLGAIALLGLVAAAACTSNDDGGNGDDGDDDGDPTATQDDGNGDDDDDDDDDDGDGNSLANLAAFGDDYDSFTGKVTYTVTNFSEDGNAGISDVSTMTIYQAEDSSRFDIANAEGDISFISTPDASYLCSSGTGGGDCLKYAADDANAGAGVAIFSGLFSANSITRSINDIPDGVDIDVTSATIAGIDATCFKATGELDPNQAGDESSEFCFSDGGLMLRLAFEGADDSGSFEATSASEDVPDSDFDPPYDVVDLDDLGDIFQP